MRKLFRSVFRRRKRRLMRLLPTTQKPLKARNAPSALTHPVARQVAGAGGTVTGLREAVGPAAQYLMLVKLVANTRPTRRVEKPCTKLLKVSIAQKSGRGKKKEVEKRKKGNAQCIFYGFSTSLKLNLPALSGLLLYFFSFEHFSAFTAWLRVITLVSRLCVCLHLGN